MDTLFNSTEKNPRGIPSAPFLEDIGAFMAKEKEFELVFSKFQERLSKYKFMLESKQATVRQLHVRIPDIENTLQVCRQLKQSKEDGEESALKFNYKLNETLFTKAQVDLTKDLNVGLWLGADVMLEYPIDEAIALLEKKLEDSQDSLRIAKEDVEFLRENITTMEVNCARLYNWDVELRKATKATEKLAI
ncbi:uncharacterized protein GVI51_K01023 [Nakaseomyces glabratus]|uniref:Prefoldin subunit 3 n=1 Tax=Candida glabrata (strain ATCC 2001 / BCRC 20586 / JCM 3761 / NBRC 0622 / NRRL Y-65 / CBS 138) TaxID=284593 RepID=Q6FNB9_CANGA|nr:uncharacterized protein CAGL0K01177g [Nakaseomyces glabratus]KAH7596833.1 Prefoldin subunit [Nakaseomyces glabratus]KAH7602604.1 Prefoldin subunit [Nakaseomyces glabratus]QHS67931.1 uncharacterized protein GVI51_K01023 [Nakaseomyces glabratus]CAG61236.1 unnamed protein product [Nakaseomyces glabratus]|eukprot:XP_448275.1 uncharacterized protein CAGL0K01177g [[Candida] glabrata]